MGSVTGMRRSTLAAPLSPERLRPPAGALLYCYPADPSRGQVVRVKAGTHTPRPPLRRPIPA